MSSKSKIQIKQNYKKISQFKRKEGGKMEQNPGETIESKYQDDQFKQNCITKCIKFKLSKNLKKQRLYRFF